MEKHFMIDIEATGIDPACEDLLQIGIVQAVFYGGEWVPEADFNLLVHTARQPESQFAKAHLADLYRRCNAAPVDQRHTIRQKILDFFRSRGATGVSDTFLMGWCAANFDVPFLQAKQVLVGSHYVTRDDGSDEWRGDFHYRIYEISGAISFAQNLFGANMDRDELLRRARAYQTAYRLRADVVQKEHDAVYDCYEQLDLLNGLLKLGKEAR